MNIKLSKPTITSLLTFSAGCVSPTANELLFNFSSNLSPSLTVSNTLHSIRSAV